MLLVFTLVFPLIGCSSEAKDESKQEKEEDIKEEKSSKKEKKDKKKKEDPVEEPSAKDEKVYVFADSIYSEKYYIVDSEGTIIKEFDSSSLTQNLPVAEDVCTCGYGDGYFFFKVYNYNDQDNGYYSSLYAVNENDFSATFLFDTKVGYISSAEYYDGALRVLVSKDSSYEEHIVPVTEGKLGSDNTEESPVLKAINDNDYYPSYSSNDTNPIWGESSLKRLMDKNGFIIAKNPGGEYASIDAKGNVTPLPKLNKNDVIRGYDSGYVIYASEDSDKVMCLFFNPDEKNGSVKIDTICPREDFTGLGFFDGKYYYSLINDNGKYMMNSSDVCVYDPKTGDSQKLYVQEPVPGTASEIGAYPSCFCVINDIIYSKELVDKNIEIAQVSYSSEKADYTSIGCVLKTPNVFKYGSVIYDTQKDTCPYCGTTLCEDYVEAFVLDPSYSEHAEEINEVTKGALELTMEYYNEPHEYSEEDCDSHLESPTMWDTTTSAYVQDVFIIDERYLAVNMSGYWYGGGAHGYPTRNQYLFDLVTGEEKTLSDFYEGSEESFKELAARYTVDDFLNYNEDFSPYYFDNSEEEIYDRAYEEAGLTASYVEFTESGVFLVYPPYDMGPYSSGWIDIFIPYQDLLNRNNLAE